MIQALKKAAKVTGGLVLALVVLAVTFGGTFALFKVFVPVMVGGWVFISTLTWMLEMVFIAIFLSEL